jgi:hypothetical protein
MLEKSAVGLVAGLSFVANGFPAKIFGPALCAIQTYDHPCFHLKLIALHTL